VGLALLAAALAPNLAAQTPLAMPVPPAGPLVAITNATIMTATHGTIQRGTILNAALATAYGLSPDEALRAITINAARIWGVADRVGSIEVGKVANLIVTTGDPMDARSLMRDLFIRGQRVPLVDRQSELYEQYRARPRP